MEMELVNEARELFIKSNSFDMFNAEFSMPF